MTDMLFTGALPGDRLDDILDEATENVKTCTGCGTVYWPADGQETCPTCCEHEDEEIVRVQPSATKGRSDVTLRCRCGRERTINVPRCDHCGEPGRHMVEGHHFHGVRCADCAGPTKAAVEQSREQQGWGPVRLVDIVGWKAA